MDFFYYVKSHGKVVEFREDLQEFLLTSDREMLNTLRKVLCLKKKNVYDLHTSLSFNQRGIFGDEIIENGRGKVKGFVFKM